MNDLRFDPTTDVAFARLAELHQQASVARSLRGHGVSSARQLVRVVFEQLLTACAGQAGVTLGLDLTRGAGPRRS
ncbi:hypothetical protein [Deinococcus pimensis]|uniref:hypothetical protein n=1 Tax=Deinococcus pimensis TaxID=309888 RepID=UPI000483357F|nr:hypothetical protein [Deinococcus pimensis]